MLNDCIPFERIARRLKHQPTCISSFADICSQIKKIALHIYNRMHKLFSPFFTNLGIKTLKNLIKNQNLVITRPEKGCGTEIINKTDFNSKMETIVNDQTKVKLLGSDQIRINSPLKYNIK